jgi:hypothetical protein
VVYVTDLPKKALFEMDLWADPAAAGGKLAGVPNHGGDLDPPPEDDPHVTFKVPVRAGIPYRAWLHMKVGKPKGKAQANLVYAQLTDAVDSSGRPIYKPGTGSFVALRGPAQEGWRWVGRDLADPKSTEPTIRFKTGGMITVRLQAGMEGVGFDQFVLSPAQFLEKAPAEPIVSRARK